MADPPQDRPLAADMPGLWPANISREQDVAPGHLQGSNVTENTANGEEQLPDSLQTSSAALASLSPPMRDETAQDTTERNIETCNPCRSRKRWFCQ